MARRDEKANKRQLRVFSPLGHPKNNKQTIHMCTKGFSPSIMSDQDFEKAQYRSRGHLNIHLKDHLFSSLHHTAIDRICAPDIRLDQHQ